MWLKIAVGSKNPAKQRAVVSAFEQLGHQVEVIAFDVPSGVANQPFSDEETLTGAVNRAKAARVAGQTDYGIGLEGGAAETSYGMLLCNWCAIAGPNDELSVGAGVRMLLPESIAAEVRAGHELGVVIDKWVGQRDIAKGDGTVGILTHGHITRASMFRDAVICAYAKFMHGALG